MYACSSPDSKSSRRHDAPARRDVLADVAGPSPGQVTSTAQARSARKMTGLMRLRVSNHGLRREERGRGCAREGLQGKGCKGEGWLARERAV